MICSAKINEMVLLTAMMRASSALICIAKLTSINFTLMIHRLYNDPNRTRQGYARKRILKLAGHFFLGLA